MDFVTRFVDISQGNDTIQVIVDRFTKRTHFWQPRRARHWKTKRNCMLRRLSQDMIYPYLSFQTWAIIILRSLGKKSQRNWVKGCISVQPIIPRSIGKVRGPYRISRKSCVLFLLSMAGVGILIYLCWSLPTRALIMQVLTRHHTRWIIGGGVVLLLVGLNLGRNNLLVQKLFN